MDLSKIKKAYFIGLGGIGVSALAKIYKTLGYEISGSDLKASEITKNLQKQGVKIWLGPHQARHLPAKTDLVVYSPAVQRNNPELRQAKKLKIKTLSYPQALGELTKKYWTIAVSGTHGKSTTTAMLALVMLKAGLDPTVIVGTKLKEFGQSNARLGENKYLLIEADEWQASFLNYWPRLIVITNIEKEHLDYYKNLDHILDVFNQYIRHLPKDGILVINQDDINSQRLRTNDRQLKIKYFSFQQKESQKIKRILKVPGQHNLANALAVLATARALGIKDKMIFKALSQFKGTWRRFEIIKKSPYFLISDYAHHPTEIRATLQAAREKFPQRRIICVFQPHQYQRTKYLFKDFVGAFGQADKVVLTEIFDVAGREKRGIQKTISSRDLAEKIKGLNQDVIYFKTLKQTAVYLKKEIKKKDVVLIMGAGDVWKLSTTLSF